jgi:hypothetical protein
VIVVNCPNRKVTQSLRSTGLNSRDGALPVIGIEKLRSKRSAEKEIAERSRSSFQYPPQRHFLTALENKLWKMITI